MSGRAFPLSWELPLQRPLVLGHRGARHAAPENTLRAFELARVEGAAGTELDVQCSADGYVHVVHDLDLTRVTQGRDSRQVRQLTRAELDRVELADAEPIPQLEAVLAWAAEHDLLLNVELKTHNARHDRIGEATAALLTSEHAQRCVIVSSFHPLLLARFRKAAPKIKTAFLVAAPHAAWCNSAWLQRLDCRAIHPQASMLLESPELWPALKQYQINTWTVNDPTYAQRIAQCGVYALISDNPGRLLETGAFTR